MRLTVPALVLLLGCATAPSPSQSAAVAAPRAAGPLKVPPVSWSSEEQALHVLDRLAYGPSPRDLQEVERMGSGAWIAWQLRPGEIDDAAVEKRLADFPSLGMSTRELLSRYPRAKKVAEAQGITLAGKSPEELRTELAGALNPFQLPRQVGAELVAARLIRATESRRQLQERWSTSGSTTSTSRRTRAQSAG